MAESFDDMGTSDLEPAELDTLYEVSCYDTVHPTELQAMSTEYTGRGDPARSMALLWGTQKLPSRGPKPGLSVERIVQAAIRVADAEGLAALSMRRVATELGVGTMSLYTYVPGKAELLDVMLDTVLGEVTPPDAAAGDWRARLEAHARELWAHYHRHPWALGVSGARALLGPNETALYESSLATVAGTGLSGREMVHVVTLVAEYARGAAGRAVEAAQAARHTGVTDDQWWQAREPLLDQVFDPERYPTVTRLAQEGAFQQLEGDLPYNVQDAVDSFEFGLGRVLDGIEAHVKAG
jgi:AcrR family transcriptional regulator